MGKTHENRIEGTLSWMYSLRRFGMKLGLDSIRKLCALLGNPQDSFKSIHIAGTNGKGSTSAMIYSILLKEGLNAGLYTSPHLVSFNERISVNGKDISDEEMSNIANKIRHTIESHNNSADESEQIMPTFFEFATALAFLYFADKKIEYAVVETGLGGRFDATNIVHSEVSIITSISEDHMEHLGSTRKQIINEKLGIVKENTGLICSLSDNELVSIARGHCSSKGCSFDLFGDSFKAENIQMTTAGEQFDYHGKHFIKAVHVPLIGEHQVSNAALAIRAIEEVLPKIKETSILRGIADVRWPARFEVLCRKPLIIADGSHNPEGLQLSLRSLKGFHYSKLIAIVGFSKDKDSKAMLANLRQYTDSIITTKSDQKPLGLDELNGAAASQGFNILGLFDSPADAVNHARKILDKDGCLLVTGSIYMVGKAYNSLKALAENWGSQ